MVRFQKLTRNVFLALHGHNVHRQREFRARFRKDAPARCVFSKPCTELTLHCNHRSGHLKTEYTESRYLLRRHIGNWPRTSQLAWEANCCSAWETGTVAAADGVRCASVRWEINFLLTFETAQFFCVYPVNPLYEIKESLCFTSWFSHMWTSHGSGMQASKPATGVIQFG